MDKQPIPTVLPRVYRIEGTYVCFEVGPLDREGQKALLRRAVEAMFAVYGERCHLVFRRPYWQLPRAAYLRSLGVKSQVSPGRHRDWTGRQQQILAVLFPSAEPCVEYLGTEYPDDVILFLEAFPRATEAQPEDLLQGHDFGFSSPEIYTLMTTGAVAALFFNPQEPQLRILSRDESALEFARLLGETNAVPPEPGK